MMTTATNIAREAFSPSEFAASLGISRSFVFKEIKNGNVQSFRLGRRRLIPKNEVDRLSARAKLKSVSGVAAIPAARAIVPAGDVKAEPSVATTPMTKRGGIPAPTNLLVSGVVQAAPASAPQMPKQGAAVVLSELEQLMQKLRGA